MKKILIIGLVLLSIFLIYFIMERKRMLTNLIKWLKISRNLEWKMLPRQSKKVSLISKMWGRHSFSRAYPIIHALAQIIGCCGVLVFAQVSALAGYNWVYIVIATLSTIGIIATAFINMNAIEAKELRISGVRREG